MRVPTRPILFGLAVMPALFAFVACTNESAPSPVPSKDGSKAPVDAAPDVVTETSDDESSFTIDGSSVSKLTYSETALGASSMPCGEFWFYERFTLDLEAKSIHAEVCTYGTDGGVKTDESRALSDENVASLRAALTQLRLISFSDYNNGECNGYDGVHRLLSLERPDRDLVISDHHTCSIKGPADTVAVQPGMSNVQAKLHELAGLPLP